MSVKINNSGIGYIIKVVIPRASTPADVQTFPYLAGLNPS